MNFFKSVFAEDSDPESTSPSPSPSPSNSPPLSPPNSNPNSWSFGTLIQTLASKSDAVLDTYKRDLADFTSGLQSETAAIRAAAARAARDLPASLEAGAAKAADSLESVGEAIDNIGSAVTDIISQGLSNKDDTDEEIVNRDLSPARPYNRIELLIRSVQCDMNTYCKEVDEMEEYEEWKLGFDLGEKMDEIKGLYEENEEMGKIYDELVPKLVDEETFWLRYFYRVFKVTKAEETRAKLVNRAMMGEEEEELSWDVDDDDDENGDSKEERDVSELKRESEVDEGEKLDSGRRSDTKSEEKLESCKDSDFSIVSSQPSMAEEEDIGWDEIEDSGNVEEIKANASVDELRKRLIALGKEEDDEDIGWDIEDDDEPLKS